MPSFFIAKISSNNFILLVINVGISIKTRLMSKRKRILIVFACFFLAVCAFQNFQSVTANADIVEEKVYIGGFPVAMVLKVDGLIVEKDSSCLQKGDVLRSINGVRVSYAHEIANLLKNYSEDSVDIEFLRKSKKIMAKFRLEKDCSSPTMGISVREEVSGIGMITYYKKNGEFVALGHKISDSCCGDFPMVSGKVFECEIIGVKKSEKGMPGEIRGIVKGNAIGEIYKNTSYGVSGTFYKIGEGEEIVLAGRNEILPGKAMVTTSLRERKIEFKAEIIKPMGQFIKSSKGMIVRVVDKNLLCETGGILQGMSGSPIVQNGKLVGAVTHVFVNDPSKGYGIYAEWMNCIL